VIVLVELVERDWKPVLAQQLAQTPHGAGVSRTFMTVADEDLVHHPESWRLNRFTSTLVAERPWPASYPISSTAT
jgi:hypothetical protein